jgi:hypothetical protein
MPGFYGFITIYQRTFWIIFTSLTLNGAAFMNAFKNKQHVNNPSPGGEGL